MSIEHMAAVLHHSRAKGTNKLVLLGIANHDGDGGAYPAHATLARYANVDERNVRRAIDKLVSLGELRVDVQAGGDRDCPDQLRPNRYHVTVTCPPWCDRTPQHRDTRRRGTAARQLGLWKTRGADTPPVGDSAPPGGADTPPVRGALAPPKPPITTHQPQVVAQPQDARERLDWRACAECSAPDQRTCESRQAKLQAADQHDYRPLVRVQP